MDLTSQRKLADRVEEAYIECGESERDEALYCLLVKHPGACAPVSRAALCPAPRCGRGGAPLHTAPAPCPQAMRAVDTTLLAHPHS